VPANLSPKQAAAAQRLQALEAVKASAIFPDKVTVYGVTKVKIGEPSVTEAFHKAFDDTWKTRVDAGLVPGFELRRYRKWLFSQTPAKPMEYPALDAADFYTKYVANDRPIADFFNEKFLEFIEKDKGRNSFANVDEYFQQLDRNKTKYYLGATWGGAKNFGRKLKLNVTLLPTTVVTATLLGYPTEIANKVMGYVWGSGKDAVANTVSTTFDNAWNTGYGFANAESLEKAINTVNVATEELANAPLDEYDRTMGVSALNQVRQKYDAIMPDFKSFIELHKKDFDTEKSSRLEKMSGHSRDYANYYDQARRELNQLEQDIDKENARVDAAMKKPGSTPEERTSKRNFFEDNERMAKLRKTMERNEELLAKFLAKYIVYSSTRGSGSPVSEEISGQYDTLLENYLEQNSLQKLRKAWLTEVNDHTAMIKSFLPKTVAKTNQEKAQSDKKAADEALAKAKEARAKAQATATAAEKKAAEEGEAAAKDDRKEAVKLKEAADKAEADAKEKAEAAKKSAEDAEREPTAKSEEKPAAGAAKAPAAKP